MSSGIWTATAGAAAQAENLDLIAANLANVDTPAYKKEIPTFREYLAATEREHQAQDIPRGSFKDKDFYPLDGRDQSAVVVDGTHTLFQQGNLHATHNALDVALMGPGFLEVATPDGVRYSRLGSLKLSPEGLLITSEGHPVLATTAPNTPEALASLNDSPLSRRISLSDRLGSLKINTSGEIYSGDELVAKVKLVEFQDLKTVKKVGGALYQNQGREDNLKTAQQTALHQGYLEGSNVNPIEEMTALIKAHRLFENDLKSLKTYGELLAKEVNEVGKL